MISLGPVAGVAGVVPAVVKSAHPQVAAGGEMAPHHAVSGVEVGCKRGGAHVLIAVVKGHKLHAHIIYRPCGGGEERCGELSNCCFNISF